MTKPGKGAYTVTKQVRLGEEDAQRLSRLARQWQCSEAAAIRRAIRDQARAAASARRPWPSGEALRQAVETARDYYATDPEAVEWLEFVGDQPEYDQG